MSVYSVLKTVLNSFFKPGVILISRWNSCLAVLRRTVLWDPTVLYVFNTWSKFWHTLAITLINFAPVLALFAWHWKLTQRWINIEAKVNIKFCRNRMFSAWLLKKKTFFVNHNALGRKYCFFFFFFLIDWPAAYLQNVCCAIGYEVTLFSLGKTQFHKLVLCAVYEIHEN